MIRYYEIENCTYEMNAQNQPVLYAPQGYDPAVLSRNGFVLLPDGRWCHYLNAQEYQHLCALPAGQDANFHPGMFGQQLPAAPNMPAAEPQTEEQRKKDTIIGNILSANSVLCIILAFVIGRVAGKDLYMLAALFLQIGLVLMIVVRVRYKNNLFGKILMWSYIGFAALVLIGTLLLLAICGKMLHDCELH